MVLLLPPSLKGPLRRAWSHCLSARTGWTVFQQVANPLCTPCAFTVSEWKNQRYLLQGSGSQFSSKIFAAESLEKVLFKVWWYVRPQSDHDLNDKSLQEEPTMPCFTTPKYTVGQQGRAGKMASKPLTSQTKSCWQMTVRFSSLVSWREKVGSSDVKSSSPAATTAPEAAEAAEAAATNTFYDSRLVECLFYSLSVVYVCTQSIVALLSTSSVTDGGKRRFSYPLPAREKWREDHSFIVSSSSASRLSHLSLNHEEVHEELRRDAHGRVVRAVVADGRLAQLTKRRSCIQWGRFSPSPDWCRRWRLNRGSTVPGEGLNT